MKQKGLSGFFDNYIDTDYIFKNRKPLQFSYVPEIVIHREKEITQIATILAPALKGNKTSNLLIYGKTGTGKTLSVKHVTGHMKQTSEKRNIDLRIVYINCKMKRIADTEYRLIGQLTKEFENDLKERNKFNKDEHSVPATGLPTHEVYNRFYKAVEDCKFSSLIVVLDEVDQLIDKAGDDVIYNLTRSNEVFEDIQISLVGISNKITFIDGIDPRVKSSLSEEELLFPPYNAIQIQDILKRRSELSFEKNVIEQGVIEKCSGYAAREHGDVRRAIDLLRVAGEIAERKKLSKLRIDHIDEAQEKIERERILEAVKTQPKHSQVSLLSIILKLEKTRKSVYTGDVYELYKKMCQETNLRSLTQRRVSDIIGELDMLGIINAQVLSKGRYGRTREIKFPMNVVIREKIKRILFEELGL